MIAKIYSVDRSGVTLPLSRPRTLNLNLKFTIGNLLVLTAVVAVVVAAIAQLGLEIGILALFLGVANVVIAMRFYAAFTEHDTNIAWTVASACVIFPLTVLLFFGVIN